MSFDGLRVLSLESRRATELGRLISLQGGVPFVAPSVREVPRIDNSKALAFGEQLLLGAFDMVIFMTGVGTRLLGQVLETGWPNEIIRQHLSNANVVARGPKPMAVLREWKVPAILVPEPNTWRDVLCTIDRRPGSYPTHTALQEYGRSAPELLQGLQERGIRVTAVPVYQWALPLNIEPLQQAVRKLAAREFDVVLFTASIQVDHLLRIAADLNLSAAVRSGLRHAVIASIGPTMTETLRDLDLPADFEPSHPKMGFLVSEAAQTACDLLRTKCDADAYLQSSPQPSID